MTKGGDCMSEAKDSKDTKGVGMTIDKMTDQQFSLHIARVLGKMRNRNASQEVIDEAKARMEARRSVPAEIAAADTN